MIIQSWVRRIMLHEIEKLLETWKLLMESTNGYAVELCEVWEILNKGMSTYSECQIAEQMFSLY